MSNPGLERLRVELERIVSVLEPHVTNIRSTRLGEYLRVIRPLVHDETGHKFDPSRDWRRHATVLFESQELAHASKQLLRQHSDSSTLDLFLKAIRGPLAYPQEGEQSSRGRNFAAELLFAADFIEVGVRAEIGIEPDLLVHTSSGGLYVACKRPKSASSVRANLQKAFAQIEAACTTTDRLAKRGVVAVDVTRLMNPSFALFMPTNADAVRLESEKLINAFLATHLQGLALPLHCIGVVLRFAFPFIDPRTRDLVHTSVLSIQTSAAPGSLRHQRATALGQHFAAKTK